MTANNNTGEKLNRILVPLGDSTFSLNILPPLTRLLEPEKNHIYLLHVEEVPEAITVEEHVVIYADQVTASTKAEAVASLQPYVRSLESLGYRVTPVVLFGDPAHEIERFALENGIDLIAMATHGRTGLSRYFYGSVAQEVMSRVEIPIMLYRVLDDDTGALGE